MWIPGPGTAAEPKKKKKSLPNIYIYIYIFTTNGRAELYGTPFECPCKNNPFFKDD